MRPDGLPYDADDPEWLRWNYATVVWGIATAHEFYHPNPLRGKKIDRYYRQFVKVGHALGGTDLPETKAETLECLYSYLPKLALTYGAAMATGSSILSGAEAGPPGGEFIDWAIRDTLPTWAASMVMHRRPNPVERAIRQASVWSVINGIHLTMGPLPEFRQAQKRVAQGVRGDAKSPTYVLGGDPKRSRSKAEQMA